MTKYLVMSQIFPLSQASSIAFRCMVAIANAKENLNIDDLAVITCSSRHHVAKVLIRLTKKGLLGSRRGPRGGFYLIGKPSHITLWNIYEATEGKFDYINYKVDRKWFSGDRPLHYMPEEITYHFISFLKNKKLSSYRITKSTVEVKELLEV